MYELAMHIAAIANNNGGDKIGGKHGRPIRHASHAAS
jgi:hypothetical protein